MAPSYLSAHKDSPAVLREAGIRNTRSCKNPGSFYFFLPSNNQLDTEAQAEVSAV